MIDNPTTRWEYAVYSTPSRGETVNAHMDRLNAAGADGWELVSVTAQDGGPMTFFLKRPLTNDAR